MLKGRGWGSGVRELLRGGERCFSSMVFWSKGGGREKGRMVDEFRDFNKGILIMMSPKRPTLVLRLVVLGFAMICAVYVCSVCLQQSGLHAGPNVVQLDVIHRPCRYLSVPPSELPFVHYPQPVNYSREECSCTPVRYFAILTMQRSGSGWFETLLNSHLNITSNGEIFSASERRNNMTSIMKTLDKVFNLDWFSSAAKNECTAAAGFKWMLNQGLTENLEEIANYFNRRGVLAIFLFRRNLLRRLVSVIANTYDRSYKLLNGTHKSHVHSKEEAGILSGYKPLINTTSLVYDLENVKESISDVLKHFQSTRHIVLFYEDLMTNPSNLTNVLKFLKVPKQKLRSRQVKIHTKPLEEQIKNWEAVYNTLNGTRYESFLNADYHM